MLANGQLLEHAATVAGVGSVPIACIENNTLFVEFFDNFIYVHFNKIHYLHFILM